MGVEGVDARDGREEASNEAVEGGMRCASGEEEAGDEAGAGYDDEEDFQDDEYENENEDDDEDDVEDDEEEEEEEEEDSEDGTYGLSEALADAILKRPESMRFASAAGSGRARKGGARRGAFAGAGVGVDLDMGGGDRAWRYPSILDWGNVYVEGARGGERGGEGVVFVDGDGDGDGEVEVEVEVEGVVSGVGGADTVVVGGGA